MSLCLVTLTDTSEGTSGGRHGPWNTAPSRGLGAPPSCPGPSLLPSWEASKERGRRVSWEAGAEKQPQLES